MEADSLKMSLDMGPFMHYAQDILSRPLTSSSSEDEDEIGVIYVIIVN